MRVTTTRIPGCFELHPRIATDPRGSFVKTFQASVFETHHLTTEYAEDYYSISSKGVIRGLHFQRPPSDHAKLVYCLAGAILDVAVDIRAGSPTYGHHVAVELTAERATMMYLPRGMAHGFLVTSDHATVAYKVETEHNPGDDAGLAWDGCGIDWPIESPTLSTRDRAFPGLADFRSPFTYTAGPQP